MAYECTICLSEYQDPVSLPCGHVYCSRCVSDHISKSTMDGFTALCPTCRNSFHIVTPSLQGLASSFHRYIMPSVRRVYIDVEDNIGKLKENARALEAQVRQLKKEKKRVVKEQNKRLEEKSEELERYKSKYRKLKETKTKASGTKRSSGSCSMKVAKRSRPKKSIKFSSPKPLR